jgi:sugar transferase (PEP-CTERM/EpsH1 system associated)
LREEAQREPFDLIMGYSSSTLPYVLAIPAAARVMDLVDVDSAKWSAYADSAWWPKRWLYRREADGVRALERQAVDRCDAVLLVSDAEVAAISLTSGKVAAIGNGVDSDFFKPDGSVPQQAPALVFTGTMDYRPNVEGVCWFVREVWPELKRRVPELTFTIVGRDPTPEVLRLTGTPGITVTGTVKDVRPYLASASVAVVPLRIARGIQNKILEAMAMGRAVVASPPAIEGLDVNIGEEVLRAESPDEWVAAVLGLLSEGGRRERLGQAARARIVADYGWASRLSPLVSLCARMATATDADAIPHRQTEIAESLGRQGSATDRAKTNSACGSKQSAEGAAS